MDNDSPTLRITGCLTKIEHNAVPMFVTVICASATLRVCDVAPAR